jgi:hypothetical protein
MFDSSWMASLSSTERGIGDSSVRRRKTADSKLEY